jgi:hypothetical protein
MKRLLILAFGLILGIGVLALGTFTAAAQDYQLKQPDICSYEYTNDAGLKYDFEYLGAKKKLIHEQGGLEEVTLFFTNTGTIPMFGDDSGCTFRPITRLGTANYRDRESIFFVNVDGEDTGWMGPNRVKLDQVKVDPGEKGSFTFTIKVPEQEAIYREFYDIVLEGKKWMEKPFPVNFDVGSFKSENRDFLHYVAESKMVTDADLTGEKSIEISIAEQKMYLKVGDIVIREFPVSTGKPSTPTPYGHTKILNKQEVRVSAAWPHYIMPKWMMFRAGGYGIHALPSLSFDNGYFWTEALNHIGTRRSHGCIRLLPQDAEFAYDFTEVGTPVWVR